MGCGASFADDQNARYKASGQALPAQASAQALPRLKLCGDCGEKLVDGARPCIKCSGADRSNPSVPIAWALPRAPPPSKSFEQKLRGGGARLSQQLRAEASSPDAAQPSAPSAPARPAKKKRPIPGQEESRYQSAAWAASLAPKGGSVPKMTQPGDRQGARGSQAQSGHLGRGPLAAGASAQSHGRPPHLGSGPRAPMPRASSQQVARRASFNDGDDEVRHQIGSMLSGPVPF